MNAPAEPVEISPERARQLEARFAAQRESQRRYTAAHAMARREWTRAYYQRNAEAINARRRAARAAVKQARTDAWIAIASQEFA